MAVDANTQIQQAGKSLIVYLFSLMKTGEIHDINNEAWLRPIDKMFDALENLLRLERQAVTVVIHEGIAQVNSHALWLDTNTVEQAVELEKWLARREAGGIKFDSKPQDEETRTFFSMFARFRGADDSKDPMGDLAKALSEANVKRIRLAQRPLRLEGVGQGVRGVAALWHYAKTGAGIADLLRRTPIEVKAARRIAQELLDACVVEQDLLCALPLMARDESPARRAADVALLVAGTARALGLHPIECADLTVSALLKGAGYAYDNPDPTEFTAPEVAATLALRQLFEARHFSPELARRVSVAVESGLGPERSGPPYLVSPPKPLPETQLIALAGHYLDEFRNAKTGGRPIGLAIELLESPPAGIDENLVHAFVAAMGFLPVGTLVELQNGDLAVVSDVDHLRGRWRKDEPPPLTRRRKIFVERMRAKDGSVIPERRARVELGTEGTEGEWKVTRTLKRGGNRDLILRGLVRRPATVVAQMGLR